MISKDFIESVIGIDEDDAVTMIEKAGFKARIVAEDGESFMVTCDYWNDRLNLTLENGKVTEASIG